MAEAQSKIHIIWITLVVILKLTAAQNYNVTFETEEEKPKGTFVGNVSSSFHFLSEIPHEEWGYIQFGFLTQSYIQTLLSLNQKTGILTTAVIIDRESQNVCQPKPSCSLIFDVAVRSSRPQSSFFAIISVTLIIKDINDNSPLFPSSVMYLEISESTVARTAFLIDSASDKDSGEFSVQGYEIGQQDGDFGLEVIRKLDGSFTVKLIVNSQLNREVKDKYSVVIIAMDGGVPKKFGALSVNITVTDVNDNSPVFTEENYNVTIHENVTIGTTIITLTAVDEDTGKNSEIIYRFSPHQLDTRVNDLFSIARNTGELIVKNKLIYESGTFYKIIVEASDHGDQPQVSQVIVTVHVLDVGNNAPTVEINLLSPGNSKIVNISESASIGTFVAHVNVNDKDTGENGEVSCVISDKNFELLRMTKGYKVVIKKTLDRETQDLHSIFVSCHDKGSPSLSASSSFLVSVSDENDFTPRFIKPLFTGTVPENKRELRTFMKVEAFDEDLNKNGEIRYSIDPASTNYKFFINENSGHIRPDQVFDRENRTEIRFTVIAVDKGSPALTGSARVKVTITDYNDNAPVIQEPTSFSVKENKNTNTLVGSLKASDADEGDNAKLMFLMKPEYEDLVPFVVYPDGVIKTNRQLDRETQGRYDFVIVVVDQGTPRLSSSANITVTVSDDNDHIPVIKFPMDGNNTVTINNDIKPGQKVVQIIASDFDQDDNGISGYAIISGNEENLFVIDPKQGGIYLSKPVTIVKQNRSFHMVISVYDGGNPSLSVNKQLVIIVKEANVTDIAANQEETANNVIIVVVVVIVTLVLSVFMIMVICFLRKFDARNKAQKKCNGSMIVAADEKYPTCFLDNQTQYLENSTTSNNSTDLLTYDPLSSLPKKKEVSFDLDETYERHRNDLHNSTLSTFTGQDMEQLSPTPPDDPEGRVSEGRQLSNIQLLQYHQALLESQTRAWLQSQELLEDSNSFETTQTEDKFSDTSEEVTASDSGKGGSEDELPTQSHGRNTKGHGAPPGKLKTHHYVAPEYRQQGDLQRQACNLQFDDLKIHSPPINTSDLDLDLCCHPSTSSCSLSHSTPRPNSRLAVPYLKDYSHDMTLDSACESHEWDTASYV